MSLIVLNSKGSDPEDFSNFMTEQIKFPKDAEVCLVSSNINRKMMVDLEASIAAGSNSIGIQLGSGTLGVGSLRDPADYTPHAPFSVNIETKGKNFPIKAVGTGVGTLINETLNSPERVQISNIARGWASAATAGTPFTLWNTPHIIDAAGSEGTHGDWTPIQGGLNVDGTGGILNTTVTGASATIPAGAGFANYTRCASNLLEPFNGNFVDLKPLWNTHSGGRLTVFTPTTPNTNVVGGGYNWRFRTDGPEIDKTLSIRGGIFDNTSFSSQNIFNTNTNLNEQNGGTAYTVWWELSDPSAAPGLEINFYARKPGSKADLGTNNHRGPSALDDGTVLWASAAVPPAPGGLVAVGIRPVIDATGAVPVYVLEAYTGVCDLANVYTTVPAAATANGTAGKIKIADPAEPGSYTAGPPGRLNFDLYRHLPLRMGCNTAGGNDYSVFCNAIHHDSTDVRNMAGADITTFSPYTFLLGDLHPNQQNQPAASGGSWDAACRQILRHSTLAPVLGYNTHYGKVLASAMLPAQAGLPAAQDLGLTRPEALNLVVTLPDLPITGYYGNSSGDGAAGTLNMNSGGNSAAIVGVIPAGNRPFKDSESGISGGTDRGEFFACPMENWICLNNPAPFSISSLRCRITDSLGNKPNMLDSTSTIVVKIKKRGSNVDFRQGGMNGEFGGY